MAQILFALVFLVGLLAQAEITSSGQEELTCGLVLEVQKSQQKVVLKPISASGELEKTPVTRMVLPESVKIAKVIKGNSKMQFCIQMPIAQGGQYRAWASVRKATGQRLSTIE
jgi:hypothetical protein